MKYQSLSEAHRPRGWRLATAEILYHMPDHPGLLQSFTWQHLDLAPEYPELRRFLDFWSRNLDGKLHSVTVGRTAILAPSHRAGAVHQLH